MCHVLPGDIGHIRCFIERAVEHISTLLIADGHGQDISVITFNDIHRDILRFLRIKDIKTGTAFTVDLAFVQCINNSL